MTDQKKLEAIMSTQPVDPCPAGLCDDRRELWHCCSGIANSHETGDDLKQLALGIRQQLRLEAKVNQLTELFYRVKSQRDKLLWRMSRVADMANDDLRRGRMVDGTNIYQIEADARAILDEIRAPMADVSTL